MRALAWCFFQNEKVQCAGESELFYPEEEKEDLFGQREDPSGRTIKVVQWYPGHIARAERLLKQQLKLVDMVVEVRDARIPLSTGHPQLPTWIGKRKHLLILNRDDMISTEDREQWSAYFQSQKQYCIFTNAQMGQGVNKVHKAASIIGESINEKRAKRGLQPRSVRIAAVGFPNVGKSALINRLVGKRTCHSAPKPGVTRQLRWVRIGEGIDLLDAPGVLPSRLTDQAAAARLAICNDIGEAAYTTSLVAAAMLTRFLYLPGEGGEDLRWNLEKRYGKAIEDTTPEEYVEWLAIERFKGDPEQAGLRLLGDYRKGYLGNAALELPVEF
ncbi:hypothetical protein CYMTET_44099 [Cymbomonas tetramitiformis]|uniref:Mitochondrial GTPase 1 n=1 Tax=Cymbomonas tetramitiformis TaxID=36881 RepID=A0AAE0C0W5_9CHLO|nr:hypothetical protein CYMTET_44099 [Cymbomonas tetramitiformis]